MIKRIRTQHLLIVTLHLMLASQQAAAISEITAEKIRLATLLRELNAIDRLASAGDVLTESKSHRYHFNYARLRADISRVSTGIQEYLSPQRATPRDPLTLHGHYRDETAFDQ
ncbi:raqprd family integrative conjugative element protein [Pseudomonas sp. 91RF]|jgi:RAQPRD family integrative conjugative element protein|uniref:integrative conjugative element protein, RAQPRD family n=1 Tax=Pseudomonas sp. 91RF TaxID=2292261 RepID=UPI000E65ED58|nr:RAQPRD family integrative conjugative element protein [Pseudomonas sp. 91RF]RIJ09680.1 raqprd family integrative conjugative element protein [Pseudomonas sp. 91RF]